MILVTGASGALGGLILDRLAANPELDVVAGSRAAGQWAAGRPPVRPLDFDQPGMLGPGFAGIDVLVFISAGYAEDDVVLARHGAVIDAAAKSGVQHVIYTSLVGSGDQLSIALPHRWTETRLASAPLETTILRNGLYAQVPVGLALLATAAADSGVFAAPWGDGRVSVVAQEDLADVAARVAAEVQTDLASGRRGRHAGQTYELAGVSAVGGADVAAALGSALGKPVRYQPTALGDAWAELAARGLPAYQVAHAISIFSNITAGRLEQQETDLAALLPGAPRPVLDLITGAVRATG
jgi:NAD(P)H dehydrogenase (quinone)